MQYACGGTNFFEEYRRMMKVTQLEIGLNKNEFRDLKYVQPALTLMQP